MTLLAEAEEKGGASEDEIKAARHSFKVYCADLIAHDLALKDKANPTVVIIDDSDDERKSGGNVPVGDGEGGETVGVNGEAGQEKETGDEADLDNESQPDPSPEHHLDDDDAPPRSKRSANSCRDPFRPAGHSGDDGEDDDRPGSGGGLGAPPGLSRPVRFPGVVGSAPPQRWVAAGEPSRAETVSGRLRPRRRGRPPVAELPRRGSVIDCEFNCMVRMIVV